MEMEVDELVLQGVLDCLLSSLSSLLKAHTQSQQMLRLRPFEKWTFSDSLARAKKLIDMTQSVMKHINTKVRETMNFREANPQLRIWERFRMRMIEQLNSFDGDADLLTQYAASIFEGSRLQALFQYLIKQNLALVKELYQAIYQFELKKTETYKKYQMKMCKPEEFRRQFERQSDYDLLFIQIRMAEVFSNLPVLNCEFSNIMDVMGDLEIQYHKTLQENIENIACNMRARNKQIIKTIDKYKIDYQGYKKRQPRAFFKSSLRYQNLNTRKTIRLSVLKAFYRTLPGGGSPSRQRSILRNQQIVISETPQFAKTMTPLTITIASEGNEVKQKKNFWGEIIDVSKEEENNDVSAQKENTLIKSILRKKEVRNYPKSQHLAQRNSPTQSKFYVNKSVRSKKINRKYLTIPATPNYLQLNDQSLLEQSDSSLRPKTRQCHPHQPLKLAMNEIKITYGPETIQQEQDQIVVTKAMPKGKPIIGKAYLLKDPAYSSIHVTQQHFAKSKTTPLSIIITNNSNLHLKKRTIQMLRYGKYRNYTRNHELVLM